MRNLIPGVIDCEVAVHKAIHALIDDWCNLSEDEVVPKSINTDIAHLVIAYENFGVAIKRDREVTIQ
jgi:hypothetical protein